jgi:hypothetical protein
MKKLNYRNFTKVLAITTAIFLNLLYMPVQAASLTTISDTLSTVKASTAANHTIKFTTPTGVAAGQTITVTFPAGFTTTGVVFGDMDLSWGATTGLETNDTAANALAGTPAGATWGAAFATQVLTITSGTSAIPAGNVVVIEIGTNATYGGAGTNRVVNPTANTYVVSLTAGPSDNGKYALSIITDDQIPVTAAVDPSLTLTVANTTLALSTLTSGAVATAGPNLLTIASNSARGYSITIRDAGDGTNPGLWNSAASKRIASATAAVTAGVENYGGVCDVSGSPTGTCTYPTNASNTVSAFGVAAPTTFASLAAGSKPTSGGDQYSLRVRAAIATTTDPGNYVDTLTVVGTMNF